jgi:hypothetical protein
LLDDHLLLDGCWRCGLLDDHLLLDGCWRCGLLDDHPLLFCCLQVPLRLRLAAQSLDGIQHILLLGEKRVPQLLGQVDLLAHHGKHLGKVHQGPNARIPGLFLKGRGQRITFQVLVRLCPTLSLHYLQGIGGSHQDLRNQLVRIQRYGRDQLLDFLWLEYGSSALGVKAQGPWQCHAHREEPDQELFETIVHFGSS